MAPVEQRLRCFHRWPSDRDPRELLDPANQWSTPWGEADHGECDKCHGEGKAEYRCRSCLEAGADPDCVICGGRVSFVEVCPTCEGGGKIDRTRRAGVSVFPTRAGLLRYLVERDADLDGDVIVELEGEPSGERDLDADAGALLVRPTRVVGVHPVDPELVRDLRERLAATSDA